MEDSRIVAITEVYYIVNNMAEYNKRKIPKMIYSFLDSWYDDELYKELRINNDNIDMISYDGKKLLKAISLYLF